MQLTETVAGWSSCFQENRHVGAIIVRDKRVMTTGYNGAPAGVKSCANSLPRCAILIKRGLQLMRNYTENADSLMEQYPTKTVPLSKQEEKRIYDMALKKIEKAGSYTPPKLKKHRRVPVCVAAAVAATCVLSAGIAAAPYIKELAGGKIGFFTDAKSQAQVQNVLDAPRGEYGGQQSDTEAHNT